MNGYFKINIFSPTTVERVGLPFVKFCYFLCLESCCFLSKFTRDVSTNITTHLYTHIKTHTYTRMCI